MAGSDTPTLYNAMIYLLDQFNNSSGSSYPAQQLGEIVQSDKIKR